VDEYRLKEEEEEYFVTTKVCPENKLLLSVDNCPLQSHNFISKERK
jgi:hypothetical protein